MPAAKSLVFAAMFSANLLFAQTRPNIVLFLPDDLDVITLQAALNAGLMPNLQTYIITTGTTFSRNYVTDARGCPTRESFLTGLYFHNLVPKGLPALTSHQCGVMQFSDKSTLPVWLSAAGYNTALIGKYLDGYGYTDLNGDGVVDVSDATYVPPGWTHWEGLSYAQPLLSHNLPPPGVILPQDNPNEYDYYIADHGTLVHYGLGSTDYQADILSTRAAQYLKTLNASTPYYVVVAPGDPHIETNFNQIPQQPGYETAWSWDIHPPKRYVGSVSLPLPNPSNFNEADVSDKPAWVQQKTLMSTLDIKQDGVQWNDRIAALRAVDDLIGNVVAATIANGTFSNTIFLFTSDNGWFYGNHRLGGKLAAYDESIAVPLYVSIGGGISSQALVASNDLVPTILDFARVAPPTQLDGTSFRSLLSNPTQPWRNRALIEHWKSLGGSYATFDMPDYTAVRTSVSYTALPNQLYTEYQTKEIEFYDYTIDPNALTSLGSDPSQVRKQQRQQQHQALRALTNCTGASCQQAEFQN